MLVCNPTIKQLFLHLEHICVRLATRSLCMVPNKQQFPADGQRWTWGYAEEESTFVAVAIQHRLICCLVFPSNFQEPDIISWCCLFCPFNIWEAGSSNCAMVIYIEYNWHSACGGHDLVTEDNPKTLLSAVSYRNYFLSVSLHRTAAKTWILPITLDILQEKC